MKTCFQLLADASRIADSLQLVAFKCFTQKNSYIPTATPIAPQDPLIVTQNVSLPVSRPVGEKKIPTSKTLRAFHLGGLIVRVGFGSIGEMVRRSIGGQESSSQKHQYSAFWNERNMEQITNKFSMMRGAALKIGQILSIQDESLVPAELSQILSKLRGGANYMPQWQLESVMSEELGSDWRSKFSSFEMEPIAAASIGQVHRATSLTGELLAVKVQYPGIDKSIVSDLKNLKFFSKIPGILPNGLFLDKVIESASVELLNEIDYNKEALNQQRMRENIMNSTTNHAFLVPRVHFELSTRRVLTSDFVFGRPIDKLQNVDQKTKNWIASNIFEMTLMEIFIWRFMQVDPNWGNFLYNPQSNKIELVDFGCSRSFDDQFIDEYYRIVKAAALNDREKIYDSSLKLGYLTGSEDSTMIKAHVDSIVILGEPFSLDEDNELFDFSSQTITSRVRDLIPVMLNRRIKPPPEQTYSIHRKLSGAYLLCTKLKASIPSKKIFWENISKQIHHDIK